MRARALSIIIIIAAVATSRAARAGDTLVDTYQKAGEKLFAEGRFDEAEKMDRLAASEAEKKYGESAYRLEPILDNLGLALTTLGKTTEAETAYERAFTIGEHRPETPEHIRLLRNFGALLVTVGKRPRGEQLLKRALEIADRVPEANGVQPSILSKLAWLCDHSGRSDEGEALSSRSVALAREHARGKDHDLLATALAENALHLARYGRFDKAEAAARESLEMRARLGGEESVPVAIMQDLLAGLLTKLDRRDEASVLASSALATFEKEQGKEHPHVAMTLATLASLRLRESRDEDALALATRASSIAEKALAPAHHVRYRLDAVLGLALVRAGRLDDAEQRLKHALSRVEHVECAECANAASVRSALAELAVKRGKLDQAEPLARRALAIEEKLFGKDHVEVATACEKLAAILKSIGQPDSIGDAEELAARARLIRERARDARPR